MGNGMKHFLNFNDSAFTIFINLCEHSWGLKSFSEWYAKSEDGLLTHWLPMASILFLKETIYCYVLRYNYLRN